MKKKFTFILLMLIALAMGVQHRAMAQNSVTIGVGDFQDWTSPIGGHYGYHHSAMLYTTEELSGMVAGSTITGMAFHLYTVLSGSVPVWIWLYETPVTDIDATQSWTALTSAATLVFNNTVNPLENTWAQFDFDTPYSYQGGNLVLLVYSEGCTTSGGCAKWGYFTDGFLNTGQAYICPKDGSPNNVNSPLSTYSRRNDGRYKSDVRFDFLEGAVTCHSVSGLHVSGITSTTAEAAWTAPVDAGTYLLQYKTSTQSWDSPNVVEVTSSDTMYSFSGLQSNTTYNLRVKNVCSASDSSVWQNKTFTTTCGEIAVLPFSDSFDTYGTGETVFPVCWSKINTYSSPRPYISATSYQGSGSMYFYAGTSGTYNMAITPPFDPSIPINTLQADFMYHATYNTDRLIVGAMSDPADANTFVPLDTIYPGANLSAWEERSVSFANYTGTGNYIAFKNAYTTTYTYSYIDNLVIDLIPTCQKPQYVTLSNVTAEGCDVSWTPLGDETAWEVVAVPYGTDVNNGIPVPATSYPFTLTGLDEVTHYDVYVRADCGGEYSNWSFKTSFTTNPWCSSPQNVSITQIAGTSAMVTWEAAEFGATAYTVAYSEAGQENWTTQTINGFQLMLDGLTPFTAYDVTVTSECDQGTAPTVSKTFTTHCLAGGEFAIGNGTSTSTSIPSYSFYNYGYSQQIYTAAEMTGPTNITSISMNMANLSQQRNYKIYLAHTSATSLSTNWASTTGAQLVFDNPQTLHTGWNTFDFTTPFAYNGVDNLLVIVRDSTGDYVSGNSWYVHNTTGSLARYMYQDGSVYPLEPTSSTSGYSLTVRNNIIFGGNCDSTVTCIAPNMYLTDIASESVTLNWVPGYLESSWEVEYCTDTANWNSEGLVNASPYTITSLTPNTIYKVRMRSDCGGEYSSWVVKQFRTACSEIITLPYTENFDSYGTSSNPYPSCWSKINTYSSDMPYINTTHFSGVGSLYFYSGTSNTYNIAVSPGFDASIDANTLQVTFMYKANSSSDRLIVGVMTDPTVPGSFVPVATVTPGSTPADWVEKVVSLANYTGDGHYIAFKNAYTTTSSYAYIDDVSIDLIPSCPKPLDVVAASTVSDTVYLTWSDPTGTSWDIIYGPTGFDPENDMGTATWELGVTDNPYTIAGLSSGAAYDFYVRSDCGGGLVSEWSTYPATAYPYSTAIGVTGADTVTGCGFTITDDGGLNGNYANNCDYVLVIYPSTDSLITLSGTFAGEGSLDYLEIFEGVGTNASDLIVKVYSSMNGGSSGSVINIGPITSDAGPVTLHFHSDVSVTYPGFVLVASCVAAPNCIRPMQLVTTGSSTNEVSLDWLAHTENGWNVQYGPTGFALGNGTVEAVATHPYTVTNLTPGTTYDFYVQADCGGGDTSLWTGPVTVTPGSYNMPVSGNNTITTCGMVIYDDGGPTSDYSYSCESYLTIYPETTGNLVSISGTVNTEGNDWDYLEIYDGASASGTQLGYYSGQGYTITEMTSTTGPLTLHFHSDASVTYPGFELTVSCISNTCPKPTGLTVSNIEENSADLSWTPGGSETSWIVEYKESTAANWTVMTSASTSYQLTGLSSLTSYDVRVKADCGDETSQYATATFTTLGCSASNTCPYTFVLGDGYGDGWNDGYLTIEQGGVTIASLEAS